MNPFTTNENKGLLWKLMIESNVFGGLPASKYAEVKDVFEKEIDIQSNTSSTKTLTEMNKKVLLEVTKKLHPLRSGAGLTQQITSADISQQRRSQFSDNLSLRQKEFVNLINSDKPQSIDFSDASDNILRESDMKNVVSSMIARREQQLNTAVASHDKTAASKWIGRSDNMPSNLESRPALTIGSAINITDVIESKKKTNLKDFLSQLSDETDKVQTVVEIKELYNEIINNMLQLNILIKRLE